MQPPAAGTAHFPFAAVFVVEDVEGDDGGVCVVRGNKRGVVREA